VQRSPAAAQSEVRVIRKLLVVLCTPLGFAAALPAAGQDQVPAIQLSQREWDFGPIWHPESARFALTVSNVGLAPLKITRVQASCGCTAAQPGTYDLAPGEATEVAVTYDSKGKQGKQTSTVTIYSNDPANPEVTFHIRGEVKRAVILEPMGGVVIRGLDPYAVQSASARVRNQMDAPMTLKVNSQSTPQFDVTLKEVVPGKEWEVQATSKPPLGYGMNRGTIVATTGLDREPTITIPISARILDRVNLVPPAFLFVREDPKPSKRGLDIEYYGTGEFMVEKVESSDPSLKFAVGQPRGPADWQVKLPPTPKTIVPISVDVPPGTQLPPAGIELIIHTNDPDYRVLKVLFTTQGHHFNQISHAPPRPAPATQPASTQPAAPATP
jgi:hypothetical protein